MFSMKIETDSAFLGGDLATSPTPALMHRATLRNCLAHVGALVRVKVELSFPGTAGVGWWVAGRTWQLPGRLRSLESVLDVSSGPR